MNKKVLIISSSILLVFVLVFVFFYYQRNISPTTNDNATPTIPKPTVEKVEIPAINKFPDQIESLKKDEKISIPSGGEIIEINNPAKNAAEIISPKDIIAKKDARYEIVYFNYPDKKSFLIGIIGKDIEDSRKAAEENLLSMLGIDKEKACKLSVSVFVDKDANAQIAGNDYGLSFCPNGKPFPKK